MRVSSQTASMLRSASMVRRMPSLANLSFTGSVWLTKVWNLFLITCWLGCGIEAVLWLVTGK